MFSGFLVHYGMDKEDARSQTLGQLHERRKQVVRLHRTGHGVMRIVDLSGLSYPTVRKAIDLYEAGGLAAICPSPRGREPGDEATFGPRLKTAFARPLVAGSLATGVV